MHNTNFNINAILSCVFSGVSWFVFWWLGPIGVGLGIRALVEIKNTHTKGKILAVLGIVLGVAGFGLYIFNKIKSF